MGLLENIEGPRDLDALTPAELLDLAQEIRDFLVNEVSQTGGHLGPNLGVVELTVGLHTVFDSPRDSIIFDTGHQSYVHKLLTGRKDFSTLRMQDGLSGYPDRAESEHDILESSHASSSLAWADGLAKARQLQGEGDRYTVAVIGDGALTGGMSWEAVNNIAGDYSRRLVIVVNDNGRSYAPTIGGLAHYLGSLRSTIDSVRTMPTYEKLLEEVKNRLNDGGTLKKNVYTALHGVKRGVKDVLAPQGMFEDLGLKYIGPIDGHDLPSVQKALRRAKAYQGPVLVHAITQKGHGYAPAINDEVDQFHAVGVIDPSTGEGLNTSSSQTWTSVFSDEVARLADHNEKLVGITAAMLVPVGLNEFARKHPDRVFDVGIAEQHAIASAAGMAYGGLHPVVAIYATFLNRGFDQLLMDVALHKAGVTLALDRSGVTGPDGPSHHGMWDLSILQVIPGIHIAAPRDEARLREELGEAVAIDDAPTVVRFPKGAVGQEIPQLRRLADGVDVLAREGEQDVLIVAVGSMANMALEVSERLSDQGIGSTVIDPRWVLPVPGSIITMAAEHRLVITIEDGVRIGGVGSRIRQELRAAGVDTGLNEVGLPGEFLKQGSRSEVLARVGLTPRQIARDIVDQVLGTKVPFARPVPGVSEETKHPGSPTGELPRI